MSTKGIIGVIGSGEESSKLNGLAFEVGTLIARAGYALINGGLGGVMEASARGAKEAGGLTIGLLPGLEKASANPYIEVILPTGMGDMRNALIVRASLGIIAIGGGAGTLSELALALKANRPIVGLGTWDISEKILEAEGAEDAVEETLNAFAPRSFILKNNSAPRVEVSAK